jgi:hypothetical protein
MQARQGFGMFGAKLLFSYLERFSVGRFGFDIFGLLIKAFSSIIESLGFSEQVSRARISGVLSCHTYPLSCNDHLFSNIPDVVEICMIAVAGEKDGRTTF